MYEKEREKGGGWRERGPSYRERERGREGESVVNHSTSPGGREGKL